MIEIPCWIFAKTLWSTMIFKLTFRRQANSSSMEYPLITIAQLGSDQRKQLQGLLSEMVRFVQVVEEWLFVESKTLFLFSWMYVSNELVVLRWTAIQLGYVEAVECPRVPRLQLFPLWS